MQEIGEWHNTGLNLDLYWKDTICKLFENYADRVPGSFEK
jgi:trehalose-6-phosphatase